MVTLAKFMPEAPGSVPHGARSEQSSGLTAAGCVCMCVPGVGSSFSCTGGSPPCSQQGHRRNQRTPRTLSHSTAPSSARRPTVCSLRILPWPTPPSREKESLLLTSSGRVPPWGRQLSPRSARLTPWLCGCIPQILGGKRQTTRHPSTGEARPGPDPTSLLGSLPETPSLFLSHQPELTKPWGPAGDM